MTRSISETDEIDAGTDDLAWIIINTVDNRLDDVLGVRPGRAVGRMLTAIAPANVIHNVTNLDKPDDAIRTLMNRIESDIQSRGLVPTFPKQTTVADAAKHPIPSVREMESGIEKPIESEPPVTEPAGA